jgi:hypothetical protein
MGRQQPIHVVVERRGGRLSGCGTALALLVLVGLAVQYWYVALAIVAIVVVAAILNARARRRQTVQRPGPRDPWLNEVAVALADVGLTEIARNTGTQLGGTPIEGDIGLQAERFEVHVTLFSDHRLARQAELGLLAKPDVRDAIARGRTAIRTVDRVVFAARGRGGVVDEFRLDEVAHVVGQITVPPALRPAFARVAEDGAQAGRDVLEQLRKLGGLREAGVLTDAEFDTKKAELLDRL